VARRPVSNDPPRRLKATSAVNIERLSAGTSGLFARSSPRPLKKAAFPIEYSKAFVLKIIKQEGALN
jgi:hypothetical protein